MKTYLTNQHLKDDLIARLLDENNGTLLNAEVLSLKEFACRLMNYQKPNAYTISKLLKDIRLSELCSYLNDSSFLEELYHDKALLSAYGIDIDQLDLHPEYKLLLEAIPHFPYAEFFKKLNETSFEDCIIEIYGPDLLETKIIKIMTANKAVCRTTSFFDNEELYYPADDSTSALDMIAQYIIKNRFDLKKTALIAPKEQFDLLSVFFALYNIPLSFSISTIKNPIIDRFKAIVEYYRNPDSDHYYELVKTAVYPIIPSTAFKDYLFNHTTNHLAEFDRFINDDGYYHDLEIKARAVHDAYLPLLRKINACHDLRELFVLAFAAVDDRSSSADKLKKTIEGYDDTELDEAFQFIMDDIEMIEENDNNQGLKTASFGEPLIGYETLFVLEPDSSHYPGFKGNGGFLNDEDLCAHGYPSLQSRFDNKMAAFSFFKQNRRTIYVLSKQGPAGQKLEYDEIFFQLPKLDFKIDDYITVNPINYNQKISNSEIFFQDGRLVGSISSFERYFNCPYAYFLRYGLKLKEDDKTELNAAYTGRLIHFIFETLLKEASDKKHYYQKPEQIINRIIDEERLKLYHLFPLQEETIKTVLEKIKDSVMTEMIFIAKMEEDTDFIPYKAEEYFKNDFMKTDDTVIAIRGIIDRIDILDDRFRIIDYKTSRHHLSKNDFKKGQSLQLLTYLFLYRNLTKMKPSGAFYLNVSHPKITGDDYAYNYKRGFYDARMSEDEYFTAFIKAHRLDGLAIEDLPGLDRNYECIASKSKKYLSKDRLIDEEKTDNALKEIYTYLVRNLKDGNIAIEPSSDACQYCPYHLICHFKGIKGLNEKNITNIDIGISDDETE